MKNLDREDAKLEVQGVPKKSVISVKMGHPVEVETGFDVPDSKIQGSWFRIQ